MVSARVGNVYILWCHLDILVPDPTLTVLSTFHLFLSAESLGDSGKMLRLTYAAEPLFQVLELQMLGFSGVTQFWSSW